MTAKNYSNSREIINLAPATPERIEAARRLVHACRRIEQFIDLVEKAGLSFGCSLDEQVLTVIEDLLGIPKEKSPPSYAEFDINDPTLFCRDIYTDELVELISSAQSDKQVDSEFSKFAKKVKAHCKKLYKNGLTDPLS